MVYRKVTIKDNNGDDYVVADLEAFLKHLLDYHFSGISLHEEKGHYFTVNDAFRNMIESLLKE
jgi:hypothetical protein